MGVRKLFLPLGGRARRGGGGGGGFQNPETSFFPLSPPPTRRSFIGIAKGGGVTCEMSSMWSILWNKVPHMKIVQIVLDKKLLHAADQAAKRTKRNRSALVRDALREHLRRLELRASEERDRQGYSRQSQADAEARGWESEATWPEDRKNSARRGSALPVCRARQETTGPRAHPQQRHRVFIHGHGCACHFHHSRRAIGSRSE